MEKLKNKLYKALRWSEKYTRTDMVYLAKGGGWMFFGRLIAMACAFGLSLAFANLLPKEVYGQYKYVISVVNILTLFTLSGMGTAVTRAVAQGKDGVLKPAIKTEMKWGLLGAITAFGLAAYYYSMQDYGLAYAFSVVTLFAPFMNVYSLYGAVLQGKKMFDVSVRYDAYTQLTNFALMVTAILLTNQIWILVLPFLFANSWLQKVWLWRTSKKVQLKDASDDETIKYGIGLSWIGALNSLSNFVDQVIVFHFLGPVQTAVYAMAMSPTDQMKGVFKIVGSLALPKFSDQSLSALKKEIMNKGLRFGLLVAGPILLYILLAPWLYSILFPAYASSVFYTQILAVSIFAIVSILPLTALQAQKKTKELYRWNIFSAIMLVSLLLVGVLSYGLMGVVLARVISRFFDLVYLYVLFNKSETN